MMDLKIVNGTLVDGTGAAPRRADVGTKGERIADMGDLANAEATRTIDATGHVVCPGFIDVHSHSDAYLLIEPDAPSKLAQGVTTEVVGNCGASAAPLMGDYKMPSDWLDKDYPEAWSTVAEYRGLFDHSRPALNAVLLIGHNTLRAGTMGYEPRHATADELAAMKRSLDQALAEGGAGLSSGLVYAPGLYAPHEELIELAKVVSTHSGIYTSHMRNEGDEVEAAVRETIAVGREAGVRVEVSHLKASGGQASWPCIHGALKQIEDARAAGLEVAADRYPYLAGATDLDVVFPAWAAAGGRATVLGRLRDPATRQKLRQDLVDSRPESDWAKVAVGSTTHPDNTRFRGRRLPDVANELGVHPVDAILHLCDTDELMTGAFFFGMSEENMFLVLGTPFVMLGSDASIRAPWGPLSEDYPHPRAYGTYPRFLRWALDGQTVPLPEAVRKMTSFPADHFRLKDRGRLEPGRYADIVVFDPDALEERTSYGDPHQLAEGVTTVVVNGTLTRSDNTPSGERNGRFIEPTA